MIRGYLIIFVFAAMLLQGINLNAKQYNGKGLYLLGDSAEAFGRGGTGVSAFGLPLFYMNPASIASLERMGLSLQAGEDFVEGMKVVKDGKINLLGDYINPNITFGLPTAWGNLAGSFRLIHISDEPENLETAYSFSFGMGKPVADKLMFGISAKLLAGNSPDDKNLLYAGATLGTIYSFEGMNKDFGFGLFKPRLGLSFTAGMPFGGSGANMNNITLGYNFKFFKHKNFDLGLYNDISFLNYYRDFPVKVGLESLLFDRFVLRTGGIFMNGYDFATLTGGLGYVFDDTSYAGSIDYSMGYNSKSGLSHYVGATILYGRLDEEAPKTSISTDHKFISPNHDGVQDYVTFTLDVKDQSRIKGWQLRIVSPEGSVVREFKPSDRDIIKPMSFNTFVQNLFSKKASLLLPNIIIWDGTDVDGTVLWDGKYVYSFSVWDERNNIAEEKTGVIIIDNTPPVVALEIDETMFSPNNDGNKDTLLIKQNIQSAPDDKWYAFIRDVDENIIKSYIWNGSAIPSTVTWDGKDDKGENAPEGLYSYSISSTDMAGNAAFAEKGEIILTRQYQTADIRLERGYLSYKKNPAMRFYPVLSDQSGLVSYTVSVLDRSKKPVYEFKGTGSVPKVLSWQGLDADGKELKDGLYYVRFETLFNSGNSPASFDKRLVIDSTPPKLSIKSSPEFFSPDDDGENDMLTINASAAEDFGIAEWIIEIKNPSGITFKTFRGTGDVPPEIKWDGIGDNKDIVESAVDYGMTLYAVDRAGNSSKTNICKISIDILIIVTERGLKMRISNIEFAFNSDKIEASGTKILDRVYKILQAYARYNVIIEGHTDDIGEEQYNQTLSERRANAVLEYLAQKGIARERLQAVGMGESVSLYPNINEENRRRNRRVEFLLIKNEEQGTVK